MLSPWRRAHFECVRQLTDFRNQALALTPCIFSCQVDLPRKICFSKIVLSSQRRAHFGLVLGPLEVVLGSLWLSWGSLGLSWACLGLSCGYLGPRYVFLKIVLSPWRRAENDFFQKSSSGLDAVHIFVEHHFISLGVFFEHRALATTPCTFWVHLRPSWACLGLYWALSGLSWALLGLSWVVLGLSWAVDGLRPIRDGPSCPQDGPRLANMAPTQSQDGF